MRSAVLLSSVLAIGAIAKPIDKRYYVTEVDVEVKTVVVYVTPGAPEPTVAAAGYGQHHRHSHASKASSSPAAVKTVVVSAPKSTCTSSAYSPPPAYTPTPTPVQSSKAAVTSAATYDGTHPTGTAQQTLSSGPDYQAAVLYHHNAARANHGAGALQWDDEVAATAQQCAELCKFKHMIPEGAGQGQNIFTSSGNAINVTAAITESWYKGEFQAMMPYYGQSDLPDAVFEQVGHLTQMLWKETTHVGCYSIDCGNRMTMADGSSTDMNKFTVCNYKGPGNVGGQYGKNVGSPISTTNLGSWSD